MPGTEPSISDLLPEISREIDQVAHFGSAGKVKQSIATAGEAFDAGEFERAVPPLLEAKTKAPRSVYVRELLGLAYYHLGQWREAARELAAYRRLSDKRDRDPELADCERALGRPEKAVEILSDLDRGGRRRRRARRGADRGCAGAFTDLGTARRRSTDARAWSVAPGSGAPASPEALVLASPTRSSRWTTQRRARLVGRDLRRGPRVLRRREAQARDQASVLGSSTRFW